MKLWGNGVTIFVLILGAIWALQGANLVGGSFMTGQSQWLYIGAACVLASLAFLWWFNFARRGH